MKFLFEAFVGGLLVFLTEELFGSWRYSLPTIAICVVVGFILALVCQGNLGPIAWIVAGALVGALAAILRITFVHGGFVTYLASIDSFATQGFYGYEYFLFALSGAVGGLCICWAGENSAAGGLGILGIVLGVLYHLKVADGWWSGQIVIQPILFVGEFLAPAAFAVALALIGLRIGGG